MNKSVDRTAWLKAVALVVGLGGMVLYVVVGAQGQASPSYQYDPGWPQPLPNK